MKALKLALFAILLALALTPALTPLALAAPTTQVVTESDITRQAENTPPLNNWVLYTRAYGHKESEADQRLQALHNELSAAPDALSWLAERWL